jgi:biuret amidohydrolase
METAYGLNIAQTLREVCDPQRIALLVYDMQVGILSQIKNPEQITGQVFNSAECRSRRRSSRVLFAASFVTERSWLGANL